MIARNWIDVSVPLSPKTPHWPDDAPFARDVEASIANDRVEVSRLSMSSHTGTHVDAPAHYLDKGVRIGAMPLDATIGPCLVVDCGDAEAIGVETLARFEIKEGGRLLLRTKNSKRRLLHKSAFVADYAYLTSDGAAFLAEHGLRCVGIDYLSIGDMSADGVVVHQTLLSSGVWIIEGLDLTHAPPGEYDLMCLPLRVVDGEGAPARALLHPLANRPEGEIDFVDDAIEWASKTG